MLQIVSQQNLLKAEMLGADALPRLVSDWEDLCTRTVEENIYYTPRYARALLDNLSDKDVLFAVVWQDQRLVALLPVVADSFALTPLAPSRSWLTPYTYSCTPLLDAGLAGD